MLQKPPLERVVGNDNNTTPKTAHETCKNIATKTENTSEVSKDGASAESSDAPEKAQFTCDSEQIKKNQDTEHVTENLLTNNAKQLNGSSSEHSGATNSSETDIKENIRLVELINTIFFTYSVLHINLVNQSILDKHIYKTVCVQLRQQNYFHAKPKGFGIR